MGKRIWRISVANPWQSVANDAEVYFREPLDTLFRLLWLIPFLLVAFSQERKNRHWLILLAALPLAIPVLLVHSGYLKYNISIQVVLLLLGVHSYWVLRQRRLRA